MSKKSIYELQAEVDIRTKELRDAIRNEKKKKKRRPLSKTLMKYAVGKEWFIILFTCIYCWIKSDSAPLLYLIPAVFIEIGVEKAFYFNSSKATSLKSMELNYDAEYDNKNFTEV